MNNDNLALKIIDEIIDDQSDTQEGFIIDNDTKAEWALRKIAEERAETQRYINVCKTMINEYQTKIQQAEEKLKGKTSFLEAQLQRYFESVPHNRTKTQETYKLPAGTLKVKYSPPEFKRDDEQLIKWLKENSLDEFLKVEEKANWSELKKKIRISGDIAITEDGQIVEGIKVVEKTPVFEVET
ncbi:MAG: host-nuclease inhibitor Gam family protein [Clostridia bacterium]|nr:host-nuclease inhibitor Gam family protein [Clostridia bacterium]